MLNREITSGGESNQTDKGFAQERGGELLGKSIRIIGVEELEKVYTASGQIQAHVIKGRLESEGIPVLLRYNSGSTVFGLTVDGLGEVEILVPREEAARARKILSRSEG